MLNRKKLEEFKDNSLVSKVVTRGTNQNDDIFFQNMEAKNENYDRMPDVVNEYMKKINEITGKDYKPFQTQLK